MKSLLSHRAFRSVTSRWVILSIELVLSGMGALLTMLIFFRIRLVPIESVDMIAILFLNTVISALAMLVSKSHHGLIRYSEIRDLFTVLRFAILQLMIWLLMLPVVSRGFDVDALSKVLALIVNTLITSILMSAFRLLVKEVYTKAVHGLTQKDNVVIYGAGDIGMATKNAIEFDKKSNCRVIAFIDDSPEKVGKVLNGKRIMSSDPQPLQAFLLRNKVREIILSVDLDAAKKASLSQLCIGKGIHITVIPPLSQWIKGIFNRSQLKELTIESLLGRDKIELLNLQSRQELEGKVMLVTGAAGSIGSDICRQLCRYNLGRLILVDQSETGLHDLRIELGKLDLDFEVTMELATIRDRKRIDNIFRKYRPHFVFHAAAYKHVPILEEYPSEVALTNVLGTKNLADAAIENQVEKFVMISTDKAVNPTNLMGACKRIGEIYVQALSENSRTQFITTRFGNVLGSNGSVVPLFKQQIAQGGPVTVTHPDITRYFMTIPEASSLVLEAAVMGRGGEIFVFDMGQPVKIIDLARKMIQLAGFRPDVDIPIHFTGLRPGEKMFEELFKDSENLLPTHHPKIMKAHKSQIEAEFNEMVCELVASAQDYDDKSVRSMIRVIVPEYRQHIAFESSRVKTLTAIPGNKKEPVMTAITSAAK